MADQQTMEQTSVSVQTADASLEGDLTVPDEARGIVVFAHGSGSSRLSPRNQSVAEELNPRGLAYASGYDSGDDNSTRSFVTAWPSDSAINSVITISRRYSI